MMYDWVWLVMLCMQIAMGESLPNIMDKAKDNGQAVRPKPKRAQETVMFGNQQNRPGEGASQYTSASDKRTPVGSSGLGGLKAVLGEEEKSSRSKAFPNNLYDRDSFYPYEKSYEYDKVNELAGGMPRVLGMPPYYRYYVEDRSKRSEKSGTSGSTTARPSTTTTRQVPTPTQQSLQAQVKRSVPIYQEPRFKRELDIDPEDLLALLSLWEYERRNGNLRKYIRDEYENGVDDDGGLLLDEDDARNVIPWVDAPVYPSRHYGLDTLSPSDIGIVRTHPPDYYEQYGNQFSEQYETASQYASPQYGTSYPQRTYYNNNPEKRFMVARKRSQSYEPYSSAAQVQLASQTRGYPYQHRLIY